MYSLLKELREALENCSGKVVGDSSETVTEMVHAFNGLYKNIKVTFSKTPETATIVVKDGTKTVTAELDGSFILHEKAYTYDASAVGYLSKVAVPFVVTQSDVTAGTKAISVTIDKYCLVTFTKTPVGLSLVLKDVNGAVVDAETNGTYKIAAGSYSWSAMADGYTSKEDQALTISSGDATTGVKTVEVTLEVAG